MTRWLLILTACTALVSAGGCRKDKVGSPATVKVPASKPATTMPDIPGLTEDAAASDELLVNPPPPRKRQQGYTLQEDADAGALRVICRIPSMRVALPAPRPIDFTGKTAIDEPRAVEPYKVIYDGIRQVGYDIANELDFYRKWNPPLADGPLRWLAPEGDGLVVNGAAIIVEGIKAGRREELVRGSALVNHRYRRGNYIRGQSNYSGYNIAFVPPNEKIVLRSGDHFPCRIVFRRHDTGQAVGEPVDVPALPFKREGVYAGWILRANPGSATQPRPIPAPSPTLREEGVYSMRCLRHAWHVGYAVVVANPYVAVSGAQRNPWFSGDGKVTIDDIPPGTWKVKIWHRWITPIREVHEVKIERDETTHLVVDFAPPRELLDLASE